MTQKRYEDYTSHERFLLNIVGEYAILVLDDAKYFGSAVPAIPRNIAKTPLPPKGARNQSGREYVRDYAIRLRNRQLLDPLVLMSAPSAVCRAIFAVQVVSIHRHAPNSEDL